MDPWSDYPDEMDRLTPEQIEELLAGRTPEGAGRLAELLGDLRGELTEVPDDVERRHLAAMASASGGPATTRRKAMTGSSRRRTALLGLAAVLALGMGVAGAVTLPDQASDQAKDVVGNLPIPGPTGTPGEDPPGDANDHGEAVSEVAQDDSLQGCEKGMAVADVASGGAANPEVDPCAQGHGSGNGNGNGGQGAGGGGGAGGSDGGGGAGGGGSTSGGGGGGAGGSDGGGGAGGGGSTSDGGAGGGSGGVPDGLPTPEELPGG